MTDRTFTRDAEELSGISSLRLSVPHDQPPNVDEGWHGLASWTPLAAGLVRRDGRGTDRRSGSVPGPAA